MNRNYLVFAVSLLFAACGGGINDSNTGSTTPPPGNSTPTSTDTAQATIPASGGSITLPSVATITFPNGSFNNNQSVTIAKTSEQSTADTFTDSASIFGVSQRIPYEIRLNTGASVPADGVEVTITVPSDFLSKVQSNEVVEVFVQVPQAGADNENLDVFTLVPSTFDATKGTVTVTLPPAVFSNQRRQDGNYELVVTLASVPATSREPLNTTNAQQSVKAQGTAQPDCPIAIGPPLIRPLEITSNFAPVRPQPVTGQPRPHEGTDFRAADGDSVIAVADGLVSSVRKSPSYGNVIEIKIASSGDPSNYGAIVRYAHLKDSSTLVQVGTLVKKGDLIAAADTTGKDLTGPHLHFEYVPNGKNFGTHQQIDPTTCIGKVSGSIQVGDNGSVADDAFLVVLDSLTLGTTTIGASNNFAVSSLNPGNHSLTVTAVTAPDNDGTLGITLSDGLTFQNGLSQVSADLTQGQTVTYTIVVPQPGTTNPNIAQKRPFLRRQDVK